MRTLHYIQHVSFEHPGAILDWAEKRQIPTRKTRLFDGDVLPSLASGDLLLVMGGPMGVHDDDAHPWMVAEKAFIREAYDKRVPILGICLGAQLIAHVLGADVTENPYTEIGFYPVTLTKTTAGGALFSNIPRTFTPFHWHSDTFLIPQGAARIAGNNACMNQGFLGPGRVMGLQFHLEADRRVIAEWRDRLPVQSEAPYTQSQAVIMKQVYTQEAQNTMILETLLDRFYLTTP